MGDYTIRISTSLIEQLARDDEKQVKRRTRKPRPKKVVEQPEEPQDNGREVVEAIRAVVAESEKVLEKLQKKEAAMREELTKRAKELHDKEFKLPYQNPSPCTDERAGCAECYRSNVQDPLKCAEAVKRFEACVRMARRGGATMGAAQ
ncbi:hypothetical protein CFC21_000123 [Triticum aestivum]|uniref:Uncharacterized protein n=1 Tax=Triticum aestivum TaxID=4565 RepID=A0A3B5XU88_WHEAT|nr:hypothetical protein CFC21_000123 [Triticum aestivum]